jgi:hypothetical protein
LTNDRVKIILRVDAKKYLRAMSKAQRILMRITLKWKRFFKKEYWITFKTTLSTYNIWSLFAQRL